MFPEFRQYEMKEPKNPMDDGSFEEAVVVRYLLGELPEETQVQMEDRAFSDPEYMRVIEAVEADLIDAYVRGQLPPEDLRRFESRFLASPERRRKVEFARTWAQVADEAKPAAAAQARPATASDARRSWLEVLGQLLRSPMPAFQFATAALAVILVCVVSWQVVQSNRLRSRIGALEAERERLQQQEQALQKTVDAERSRAEDLSAQLQRGALANVASLALLPGMLRGEAAAPQLVIPHQARIARVEIHLEPRDRYPQFRVELHTERGEEILTRNNLREQKVNNGRGVVLEIPSSALTDGNYELALKGVAGGKQVDDLGYYRFSVKQK
jgi:hypothetical protein